MTATLQLLRADDPLREKLAQARFVVEANNFEKQCLWQDYKDKLEWESIPSGELATVGHLDGRPVCLSILWARLNGQLVLFQHATSQLVDYALIEEWLNTHCNPQHNGRSARCDANNFHQCLHAVRELSAV